MIYLDKRIKFFKAAGFSEVGLYSKTITKLSHLNYFTGLLLSNDAVLLQWSRRLSIIRAKWNQFLSRHFHRHPTISPNPTTASQSIYFIH